MIDDMTNGEREYLQEKRAKLEQNLLLYSKLRISKATDQSES